MTYYSKKLNAYILFPVLCSMLGLSLGNFPSDAGIFCAALALKESL